jgi:hypothetical protein
LNFVARVSPSIYCNTLDILQYDEGVATLLADLVNCAYIRVIESGRSLGLSQQALSGTLVACDFRWEKLHSHFPAQPLVLRKVNLAHPAAPELLDNAVVRDDLTDHVGTRNVALCASIVVTSPRRVNGLAESQPATRSARRGSDGSKPADR